MLLELVRVETDEFLASMSTLPHFEEYQDEIAAIVDRMPVRHVRSDIEARADMERDFCQAYTMVLLKHAA